MFNLNGERKINGENIPERKNAMSKGPRYAYMLEK